MNKGGAELPRISKSNNNGKEGAVVNASSSSVDISKAGTQPIIKINARSASTLAHKALLSPTSPSKNISPRVLSPLSNSAPSIPGLKKGKGLTSSNPANTTSNDTIDFAKSLVSPGARSTSSLFSFNSEDASGSYQLAGVSKSGPNTPKAIVAKLHRFYGDDKEHGLGSLIDEELVSPKSTKRSRSSSPLKGPGGEGKDATSPKVLKKTFSAGSIYKEGEAGGEEEILSDTEPEPWITQAINALQESGAADAADYLKTGMEALAFFRKEANKSHIKFVYLKQKDTGDDYRPYDLEVVPLEKVPSAYFIMSAQGVTHIIQSSNSKKSFPTSTLSLDRWVHEAHCFNTLRSYKTFSNNLLWKNFGNWKKNVRYGIFCKKRSQMSQNLLISYPIYCKTFLAINVQMSEISKYPLLDLEFKSQQDISEFQTSQDTHLTDVNKNLEKILETSQDLVTTMCDEVAAATKNLEQADPDSEQSYKAKGVSMAQMRIEKTQRLRSLQRAVLVESMRGDFIRLIDYLTVETLVTYAIEAFEKFLEAISNKTNKYGLFKTSVLFDDGDGNCVFQPNKSEMLQIIGKVQDQMITNVDSAQRMLYLMSNIGKKFNVTPSVSDLIDTSENGKYTMDRIQQRFKDDYDTANESIIANKLIPEFIIIDDYGKKFNPEDFKSKYSGGIQNDIWDKKNFFDLQNELKKISEWETQVTQPNTLPGQKVGTTLQLEFKTMKFKIGERLPVAVSCVKDLLFIMLRKQCTDLTKQFEEFLDNLAEKDRTLIQGVGDKAKTLNKFVGVAENSKRAAKAKGEFKTKFESVKQINDLLGTKANLSTDDQLLMDEVREKNDLFMIALKKTEEYVDVERNDYSQELYKNIDTLESSFKTIAESLSVGEYIDPTQSPNHIVDELEQKKKKMKELDERAKQFGYWQGLLNPEGVAFAFKNSEQAKKIFDLQFELWTSYKDYSNKVEEWKSSDFRSLFNPKGEVNELGFGPEFEKIVEDYFYKAKGIERKLNTDCTDLLPISEKFQKSIKEFKDNSSFIATLGSPALKDRHWAEIFKILEEPWDGSGPQFTLQDLQNFHIFSDDKLKEAVENVAGTASKEWTFEKTLEKMKEEWVGRQFTFSPYKETTHVLAGVDEIQMLLDDHIVKTQTMSGSPFARFFSKQVGEWEKALRTTQQVLEEWLKVQATYLYLEPIFSSGDIQSQMPEEARAFTEVDRTWKKTANMCVRNPDCLTVGNTEGLLQSLLNQTVLLDKIQKGLARYLETKRLYFPRFYFLANEELLEILSETADPLRVQPFLKKCFEGIDALVFAKNLDILGMASPEGEIVKFNQNGETPINPNDAKGQVEVWLDQVEAQMRVSLYMAIKIATKTYAEMKNERPQWVLKNAGQVVLCVSAMYWTSETEEFIRESGKAGIAKYEQICTKQLGDIVELVRGKLKKLERKTCSALVTIDLHARDVLFKIKDNVSYVYDFDWMSQLRYVWDEAAISRFGTQGAVKAKMINAVLDYAYEYLGNSSRLVVTPLTDRCYRTLMGAIHLNLGGAPEGPAGTGKTETTKDLAKAIAMQCVVYNCSDQLDYLAMAKFFKGLIGSGAWACFDEFNRINLEVLSVVAQQVLSIQLAKAAKVDSFTFEGTHIKLVITCNVFITMNPGYAGRSDLPDNLKVLFRTVAMMVPDYGLIAEITLYSFGYLDARNMARKIVTLYKLCSEQLSSQDHYDYGMRAVIAVLRAAGNLKEKYPNEKENILVLRAIKDVNEPKFLDIDMRLFQGIVSDLFPGVVLPPADYRDMNQALHNAYKAKNLQPTVYAMLKCIQLYEMIIVRHGLMLVGMPFAGKTCTWKVLQEALHELHMENKMNERSVLVTPLNPKSITMGQLYGCFDPVSLEWHDGVLSCRFRELAENKIGEKGERKWVMLDGPVDAIWIENMNTVLDDNKKLCLMSGQIIPMNAEMNMIFETMDLSVASPATVSRVGIVFMEPALLGWEDTLLVSWLAVLPSGISNRMKEHITLLFKNIVKPTIKYVRRNIKEPAPTIDTNLANSCMEMMNCMFNLASKALFESVFPSDSEMKLQIDSIFLFSLIWSAGTTGDEEGRQMFDVYLRGAIASDVSGPDGKTILGRVFPPEGVVYDYCLNSETLEWEKWVDNLPPTHLTSTTQFHEITVQTKDTAQLFFMTNITIKNDKPLLVVGPTGTGKSVYIQEVLSVQLDREIYKAVTVNLSAQTSANQTQNQIDLKVDKRRKGTLAYPSNIYGPPPGKKIVVFVDDLNMPKLEEYGAQPPIEILRQFMDYRGWYDVGELSFREMQDVQLLCAMGPPGGGRNSISQRMQRQFILLNVVVFDNTTLHTIFSSIMDWYFSSPNVPQETKKVTDTLVNATISVYRNAMAKLLPTPMKSHYLFNLRDLSRVIQGILLVPRSKFEDGTVDASSLQRLWFHEVLRVFYDRLVEEGESKWFIQFMKETTTTILGVNPDDLFKKLITSPSQSSIIGGEELRSLFWGDFMKFNAPVKVYSECNDAKKLEDTVQQYLDDFNSMSKKPMDLVIFLFAVEHLSRISRLFKISGANVLCAGVGGSGRKSLVTLAAYMAEHLLFSVEIGKNYAITDWKEDLKKLLRQAATASKETVFLFSDTQIKEETYVEDINSILNSGEVPNLFPLDEKVGLLEAVRAIIAKEKGKQFADNMTSDELYKAFAGRVKVKLHIALCFSPVGEAFRSRLRSFPSLVNCCTIDWFQRWPDDALLGVAKNFLRPEAVEMEDKIRLKAVELCQHFHQSTIKHSDDFLTDMKRRNYVTPTSFLELLKSFISLLAIKRKEVSKAKKRYDIGLEKLGFTASAVAVMQKELEDLQPILKQKKIETEQLMEQIEKRVPEVASIKEKVEGEALIAKGKADDTKAISDECEADLAEAIPLLEGAIKALNTLKPSDINEVKVLAKPPASVILVMEAVCVMLDTEPLKIKDPAGGPKKIDDYWTPSRELLSDKDFIKNLKTYDKDNIDPKIMKKLRAGKYVGHPDFTPENAKKGSVAAEGLCKWVCAIDSYDKVAKVVGPKKEKLAEKQIELKVVMDQLNTKQAELKRVQDEMENLKTNLDKAVKESSSLTTQAKECEVKLVRATQLITSLGSEQDRWTINSRELGVRYDNLLGDILISSGVIAYLGAFTPDFRSKIINEWENKCRGLGIFCSSGFSLGNALGDPVKIRAWNIQGLPADNFSVDNAIVVTVARRWPLLIDPQGQANKWIRAMEAENKIAVVKQTDATFLRTLENSVQMGFPVLLENVPEDLAPALEPLLLKQIFKAGGVMSIRLGDATIAYSENFRFYMTTTLRNPHYLPETAVKVSLINMMITPDGLQDQMLGIVVKQERPDLEVKRSELIVQGAKNKKQLGDIETKILEILSNSQGNILDDESAIAVLSSSKVVANDIAEKQKIADLTEVEINETRKGYKPVAYYSSALFFCIADLANIDPMYQYSLSWFINIFIRSIQDSEKSDDLAKRLSALSDWFTYSLYNNVCRSLFEKDKLTFSFLLCLKIEVSNGKLDMEEFRFLLSGGVSMGDPKEPNPAPEWLNMKAWGEIVRLGNDIPSMKGFHNDFVKQITEWQSIYDNLNPENTTFPSMFGVRTSDLFHRLLVLRTLRPDKVVPAVRSYVANRMGQRFVEPPPFDLSLSYNDSSVTQPLVFVLSPGSDPTSALLSFAENKGQVVNAISLGQGQGPRAAAMIAQALQSGQWVMLQNCHLCVSWMTSLEKIVEEIDKDKAHSSFRLWLTSYPSDKFPVPILQNGVKMTNEPPAGIRANLYKNFTQNPIAEETFFDNCNKVESKAGAFKSLVLTLCYFHALIQERRGFGPLGWNIPYEFNASDLAISVRQLEMFLLEQEKIPWDTLIYCTGHCNYGGRVTDDYDRRVLIAILNDMYNENVLKSGHQLSPSGTYYMPVTGDRNSYLEYIKSLPQTQLPEVFGMHMNADISRNKQSTELMFETIVISGAAAGGGGGGGGVKKGVKSADEKMADIASDILAKLPPAFMIDDISEKFPVDYKECFNTVLVQECIRYNRLTAIVRDSMKKLQLAIKGVVLMSSELEQVGKSMTMGIVPAMWKKRSYPSLKPLGSYFSHLLQRLNMLQHWIDNNTSAVFWISGFFFTQSFCTAAKQNFARKYGIAIDEVGFDYEFLSTPLKSITKPPSDGVYIHGLFLEGARWNPKEGVLDEQFPKQLSEECPVMWLKAGVMSKFIEFPNYDTPLYREASRRGILTTTGHSTNFVMAMKIPRRAETPESHWVKRGCCMLLELSD